MRGAEVISAARGEAGGKKAASDLAAEFGRPAHFVPIDLASLKSVQGTLDELQAVLAGRKLDILVANAGLWPRKHALSAEGYEIAFATNLLGHHVLIAGALERELLAPEARVILVTGDIYVMASECTADFAYRGMLGRQLAYCRSKLGNLWYTRELARRRPALRVFAVHPGVIASDLSGSSRGIVGAVKRRLMLTPSQGAQTSLFCATQPDLASGAH